MLFLQIRYLISVYCKITGTSLTLTDSSISDANVHFYRIAEYEAEKQEISADGDPQSASVGSQMWELPCREFDQIWESLVFDDNIKNEVYFFLVI